METPRNEPHFSFDPRPADSGEGLTAARPAAIDEGHAYPNDYFRRPKERGTLSPIVKIIAALALVAILGGGAYYFFSPTGQTVEMQGGIPVIRADQTPLKTRPDDPGGMEIPNQDKLIYDRLSGAPAEKDAKIERLLPPAEHPLAPPPPPPPPAPQQHAISPETPPAANKDGTMPSTPPAPDNKASPEPERPIIAPAPATTLPPPPVVTIQPPAPKPVLNKSESVLPAAKPKSGGYVVQLAALRSEADATKTWGDLSKRHADLLGGLKADIARVDLGDKGIFYRLRAGSLDETGARALCDQLSKRKVGCLIAQR